ncbi:hypothetical protein ACD589_24280 [Rhizobium sp. 814_E9_N1_1]|uniref:hypothetical protein n=1 Tax=unclassified Rhizobium TaxID=2613769 RepID=UPI003F2162D4
MPKLEPLWALDPIQFLVFDRYPILRFGARSENVGKTYDPDFEEKRKAADAEAASFREELAQLSPAELKARIAEARERASEITVAVKKRQENERFYNQPTSTADFQYWAKLSFWSLEEIVALSLGKDPRRVNWQTIGSFYSESDFVRRYEQHRTIVTRAKAMGQLWDKTIPSIVVAWARRMRFEIPEQLATEIEALGVQISDWKSLFDQKQKALSDLQAILAKEREDRLQAMKGNSKYLDEYSAKTKSMIAEYQTIVEILKAKNAELVETVSQRQKSNSRTSQPEIGTRERDSLLKLVVTMAIKKYHYRPEMAKNSAVANIATALRELGIPLDEDTIRKYLNEAKALLPGHVTE